MKRRNFLFACGATVLGLFGVTRNRCKLDFAERDPIPASFTQYETYRGVDT